MPPPDLKWRWWHHLTSNPPTHPDWQQAVGVALSLWGFASPDGGDIRPGTKRLAAMCGCHPDTVARHRKIVMGLGMIEMDKASSRPGVADTYRLVEPGNWHASKPDTGADEEPGPWESDDVEDEVTDRCPNIGPTSGLQCVKPNGHEGSCRSGQDEDEPPAPVQRVGSDRRAATPRTSAEG